MSPAGFRALLAITTAAHLWWFSVPSKWAQLPASTPNHFVYYGLILAAAVGLFLLKEWGRMVLLAHTAFAATITVFSGTTTVPALEAFLGTIAVTLSGLVLGISFSPPIATLLTRSPDTPVETVFVPILQSRDPELVGVTKAWLEASNIEYVEEGGRLLVSAEDADAARSILDEASSEMRPN